MGPMTAFATSSKRSILICKSWVDVARVDPMLRLRGLSLRYPNGKLALSDFDLTIAAGEFVVVLGGNGSGKTTLLRCITRTVKPSAGEIRLGEVDLCALEGEKLRGARLSRRSWPRQFSRAAGWHALWWSGAARRDCARARTAAEGAIG